jgi:hypothetical protein
MGGIGDVNLGSVTSTAADRDDFWSQVLPGFVPAHKIWIRLHSMDPATGQQELAGESETKEAARALFMDEVMEMVKGLEELRREQASGDTSHDGVIDTEISTATNALVLIIMDHLLLNHFHFI